MERTLGSAEAAAAAHGGVGVAAAVRHGSLRSPSAAAVCHPHLPSPSLAAGRGQRACLTSSWERLVGGAGADQRTGSDSSQRAAAGRAARVRPGVSAAAPTRSCAAPAAARQAEGPRRRSEAFAAPPCSRRRPAAAAAAAPAHLAAPGHPLCRSDSVLPAPEPGRQDAAGQVLHAAER